MRIWSILLILSDLKWCIHLRRSLFYMSESIDMMQKKFVFRQLSRYICTRTIQLSMNLYGIIEHAQNITLADNPFMQGYIKGGNVTKLAVADLGEGCGLHPLHL